MPRRLGNPHFSRDARRGLWLPVRTRSPDAAGLRGHSWQRGADPAHLPGMDREGRAGPRSSRRARGETQPWHPPRPCPRARMRPWPGAGGWSRAPGWKVPRVLPRPGLGGRKGDTGRGKRPGPVGQGGPAWPGAKRSGARQRGGGNRPGPGRAGPEPDSGSRTGEGPAAGRRGAAAGDRDPGPARTCSCRRPLPPAQRK